MSILSQAVYYDDQMLKNILFQWLDSLWGPHIVADPKICYKTIHLKILNRQNRCSKCFYLQLG